MKNAVNKVTNAAEELMDLIVSGMDRDTIKEMSAEDIRMIQISFKLLEASTELMVKTAEAFESQDRKLDELLKRIEES